MQQNIRGDEHTRRSEKLQSLPSDCIQREEPIDIRDSEVERFGDQLVFQCHFDQPTHQNLSHTRRDIVLNTLHVVRMRSSIRLGLKSTR